MKRIALAVLAAVLVALGGVAAVAADPGNGKGSGPPSTVPGSPGDDCSHGNSGKDCRPDPQPEHGKDCDDHGNARGNEDHCGPTETTPPPTDTTPTDTTPTTPVETTPTTPTTPEVTTSTPTDQTTTSSPDTSAPEVTQPPTQTSTPPTSSTPTRKPAPKPKPKAAATKIVKVQKKAHGVVVVTTADGRKHLGVMGSG